MKNNENINDNNNVTNSQKAIPIIKVMIIQNNWITAFMTIMNNCNKNNIKMI